MKLRPPNITVLGLFPDRIQAESAMQASIAAEPDDIQISIGDILR
jgi:homoserine trans-succinylase